MMPVPEPQAKRRLRRVGEACLWVLIIGITLVAVLHVASLLRLVVLPLMLAAVLATFLLPPVRWLKAHGWPDGVAALTVLVLTLVAIGGALALLAPTVVAEFGRFDIGITDTVDQIQQWIRESPLPLSSDQISGAVDRLQDQVRDSVGALAGQIFSGAIVALEVLTGIVLAIVILFFLLKDGERIWAWIVSLVTPARRDDAGAMGQRAWDALGGFVRGQTLVALFDAVLIGLALVVIGVPLALPLAVITFFGAYVPVIGATVTGLLAVLIALVSQGVVAAGLVLAAILVVQQLEGNVFQPIVVGRAVHVHPLAILLGVTVGVVLAGIIGAMVAAPLVAMCAAILSYLRSRSDPDQIEEPAAAEG